MQSFQLDISCKEILQPILTKQGDVGRKILVEISDGGVPYPVPEGAILSVWYSGTSGAGNYSVIGDTSAFDVAENVVTVELITQMLINKGGGTLCLIINSAEGAQLGLWNIPYLVEPIPGYESPTAEQYFTAFSENVRRAESAAERAEQASATFQTDATLTAAGKAADAKAVGDTLTGKAPAGFGLGVQTGLTAITSLADLDLCYANGWYQLSLSSESICGLKNGTISVEASPHFVCQKLEGAVSAVKYPVCAQRSWNSFSKAWGEWEWEHPLMEAGVEYRTTERFLDSPVYTMLINFENLPSNATKTKALSWSNLSHVVEFRGIGAGASGAFQFPYIETDGSVWASAYISDAGSSIRVTTHADLSAFTAYFVLKYTKQ